MRFMVAVLAIVVAFVCFLLLWRPQAVAPPVPAAPAQARPVPTAIVPSAEVVPRPSPPAAETTTLRDAAPAPAPVREVTAPQPLSPERAAEASAAALRLPRTTDPAEDIVRSRLEDSQITLDVRGGSLQEVCALLQEKSGIPILIDPETWKELGTEVKVNLTEKEVQVDQALSLLTRPFALEWIIRDGAVIIRP